MATTLAASSSSASLLLALPAALLSAILQHLDPRDAITTLTRTTKHPSFHRFVEAPGPNEAALWTELLRRRLAGFTPARAWFGLRSGDASWQRPMSVNYPPHAAAVDRGLAAALEAAGMPEVRWEPEAEGISPINARRLLFLPASVAAGKTMADFRAWMEVFACGRCEKPEAATRQCAGCAALLCGDCAQGCESEEHGDCPFALCRACASRHAITVFTCMTGDIDTPSIISPSCSMCPPFRKCEPHTDCAFIDCPGCGDVRCPDHRLFPPGMISVCSCGAYSCTRPGCRPPGQYFRLCQTCFLQTCNRCEEQTRGRCVDCGGELSWKDIDVDEAAGGAESDDEDGGGY